MNFLYLGMSFVILINSFCYTGLFPITSTQVSNAEAVLDTAKDYEMNYILYAMGYQDNCYVPNYFQDAYIEFDEPLGEFSENTMKEYTADSIEIEKEYFYKSNDSVDGDNEPAVVIQVIHMYRDGKEIAFCYNQWGVSEGVGSISDEAQIGEINNYIFSSLGRDTFIGGSSVKYHFKTVKTEG